MGRIGGRMRCVWLWSGGLGARLLFLRMGGGKVDGVFWLLVGGVKVGAIGWAVVGGGARAAAVDGAVGVGIFPRAVVVGQGGYRDIVEC